MTIPSFDVFAKQVNEAQLVIKRKYSRNKPVVYEEQTVSPRGPVRNKVLSFISSKKKVSESQMREFFDSLEESYGKKPNWGWLRNNAAYIDKEVSESGEVFYTLTKRGKRVLEQRSKYDQRLQEEAEARLARKNSKLTEGSYFNDDDELDEAALNAKKVAEMFKEFFTEYYKVERNAESDDTMMMEPKDLAKALVQIKKDGADSVNDIVDILNDFSVEMYKAEKMRIKEDAPATDDTSYEDIANFIIKNKLN